MTYEIIPYPAVRSAYRAMPNGRRLDCVVMHATAGRKVGDLWTLSGRDKKHLVSCHYYVTKAGEIYQLVRDMDIAWHAGVSHWQGEHDVNRFSIGVELENLNTGDDPYPDAQIDAVIWLVRRKVNEFHIPRSRLITHTQCAQPPGRKNDPRNFPFAAFTDAVYAPEPAAGIDHVVLWNGTYVREGPSTSTPIAWGGKAKLPAGQVLDIAEIVEGGDYRLRIDGEWVTDHHWGHWPAGGFVGMLQLQRVA